MLLFTMDQFSHIINQSKPRLPEHTRQFTDLYVPCTLNVPLVVAFPATDCTRQAYVPASFSCTVVMRSDPSFCSFIRAPSTALPSFVQCHCTVMAASDWTPHGSSLGSPLMAVIWPGSGFIITVLTRAKTNTFFKISVT